MLRKNKLILKILTQDQDLRNFLHFRKNQITIILEEMISTISISTKLWETIKIKTKMILILILMTTINKKKKVKKIQFLICLTFQEEVPLLKPIMSNSQYNNKMHLIFLIMVQETQGLLQIKIPLIKINNKMHSDLELKIRSIKICRTIMYNKCNKHKCSNNNLINKTKKSLNLFQTLYSCHKCNPISVSNNYFINNKLREA